MNQIIKPKVGYKSVKGILGKFDEVPKNWQKITIKQLGIIKSGGTPSTKIKEYWENGTIPWINSGEINNAPVLRYSKMITQKGLNESSAKMFPKNTVLIALTGATTGKIGILTFDSTTNQSITGVYPSEKFNSFFLFYLMISLRSQLLRYSIGSAQQHVNQKIIEQFLISFPPIEEQQKIASILSNMDNLIQNTDKIIQQTTLLKKALMHQLLTRGIDHTKFKKVKWLFGKEIEIPEEWQIKKLSDMVEKIKDIVAGPFGSNLIVQDYRNKGIPIIRLQNIERNQFVNKNIQFISNKKADQLAYHSYLPDDLVLAKLGDPIGKTCKVPKDFLGGIVVADVVRIRTFFKKSNRDFIEFVLNSNICEKQHIMEKIGTTRPRVNLDQIRNLRFPTPTLPEQQKIASILSNIDNLIQNTEKIIQQTTRLKKALMQQLLTSGIDHTKFKKVKWLFGKEIEIPEEWCWKKLKENSTLKGRIGWQGLTTAEYRANGEFHLVTGIDFKNGRIDWKNCVFVNKERFDQDTNIQLKKEDILVTKDGTIGKIAFVDNLPFPATLNTGVFLIRPIKMKYLPLFFYYVLHFDYFKKFLNTLKAGSTINHLYQKDFINFYFVLPSLKEQQKITSILSNIDSKINTQQQYKQKAQRLKQALMQKLLTGQVRVTV